MKNYNKDIINFVNMGEQEYISEILFEEKVKNAGINMSLENYKRMNEVYKVSFFDGGVEDCFLNILRGRIALKEDEENEYLDFIIDFNKQDSIENLVEIESGYANVETKHFIARTMMEYFYVDEVFTEEDDDLI